MFWTFQNPVEITFGPGALSRIGALVGGRRYCLITYGDPPFKALAERVSSLAGAPVGVIDNVGPNPNFQSLSRSCELYGRSDGTPEVIVALGGGSVIDAAKVVAAAGADFSRVRRSLENGVGVDAPGTLPLIAVPTTAGTGSEVTCWATVWDTDVGKKYSLARRSLYPEHALVDPELMLGMPRALTIATGLDALSHALESIWNVNANEVSSHFAVFAGRELLETLPRVVEDPGNLELRTRAAQAALFAGLAFSNTKTALAHSLSYPITLRHGVPHGIACAFSLPMVMRSVIGANRVCDSALERIFGRDLVAGVDRLTDFLVGLGVSVDVADYGVTAGEWQGMIDRAFDCERGKNFIGLRENIGAFGEGRQDGQRN